MTFERIAPVFASLDVKKALAVYEQLGFTVDAFGGDVPDPIYGFMRRDGVELHIARVPHIDKKTTNACCYLYVDDADALFAQWSTVEHGGTLHPPSDTSYGLLELGFVDQDGNLIRVGSPLAK
jgi:hypothetical protein